MENRYRNDKTGIAENLEKKTEDARKISASWYMLGLLFDCDAQAIGKLQMLASEHTHMHREHTSESFLQRVL